MAKQSLGIGGSANDGTGDTLRAASDKVNDNFLEIYTLIGDGTTLTTGMSSTSSVVTLTAPTITGVVGGTQTSATITTLTGTTLNAGTLALAAGSVTDSSGAISFGDENLTTTGTVTSAGLTIGSAVINEAELETIDGITAGTVIASKAIVTDSDKDITGGRNITISGELDAATGDFSGDVDVDGTLEADAITIGGVTLSETISDTVGAMVTSNTETGITVTYDDADNTLDFAVGTLNQNTTGSAATLTTARTIGGTSFDGSANIAVGLAGTATALATARTIGGVSFDGTGNINLPGVNAAGNQSTSGLAGTATALATARTIGGTSFDGTANIAVGLAATATALATARTIGGTSFDGSANIAVGLAATATTLATARTIAGVSFNGSANITLASTDLTDVTATAVELNILDASAGNTAVASDVASSAGAVTSNNFKISHTLTLAAELADDAEHADVVITSDKCLATSTVIANASIDAHVDIHTVVAGSFKVRITNKSGGALANDSTMVLNYKII